MEHVNSHAIYIYILYYYDPYGEDRMHQCDPVAYSTFEQAVDLIKIKTGDGVQIINPGARWRGGNYWIDRRPIIDSFNRGLEHELIQWSPFETERGERIILPDMSH